MLPSATMMNLQQNKNPGEVLVDEPAGSPEMDLANLTADVADADSCESPAADAKPTPIAVDEDANYSEHTRPATGKHKFKTGLNCLQINLHHCKAAMANLSRLAAEKQTYIVLAQEPYIYKNKVCQIPPGFECISGSLNPIRACVFVHKSLTYWMLPQFTDADLCSVVVQESGGNSNNQIIFSSVYMPGDSSMAPPSQKVRELATYSQDKGICLILGGDTNAHHAHWGSSDVNVRGEQLLDYVLSSNLIVCNQGVTPTFKTASREEVLDITLISSRHADMVRDWKVLDREPSFSDHCYISFMVNTGRVFNTVSVSYNAKRINWPGFQESLACKMLNHTVDEKVDSLNSIEKHSTFLVDCLMQSFHDNTPLCYNRGRNSNPWWNPELTKLRKKARKLMTLLRRRNDPVIQSQYRDVRRDFKKAVRQSQRSSWRQFCQDIEGVHPVARLVKTLSLDKTCKINTMLKSNGKFTSTPIEALNVLLDNFFPGDVTADNIDPPVHAPEGLFLSKSIIREDLIIRAMDSFKPFKSPGPDGIRPCLLHYAIKDSSFVALLCKVYQACLIYGYVPSVWREARVVFIPKPGKKDYSEVKSFRPISLTSFFLKSLERLVLWRLQCVEFKDHPVGKNQYAFTTGKSSENALHQVVNRLEKAILGEQFALAAFVDIEGAFDNVRFDSFKKALEAHHAHPVIIRWIDFMLRNRRVHSTLLGVSASRNVRKGGAQGGVLTPSLWNIVINPVLAHDPRGPVHKTGFADDVAAVATGPDPSTLRDLIQGFLNVAARWATDCGLKLSLSKTCFIMFTHKLKWDIRPLKVYGVDVQKANEIKYLGVTLDSKLSWIPHCTNKAQKAIMTLAQIRRAVGVTWGLTPKNMWWVYRSVVRPSMTYGSLVWSNAIYRTTALKKLARVQSLACRMISGAFQTSPTAGIEVALNILPMDIFLRCEAMKAAHRLGVSGCQLLRTYAPPRGKFHSHSDLCIADMSSIPTLHMPPDAIPPSLCLRHSFRVEIADRASFSNNLDFRRVQDDLACFTDGSKMGYKSGCGLCVYHNRQLDYTEYQSLGSLTTVFQAEVYAINLCASYLLNKNVMNNHISIYSDSQAAIKALGMTVITSKTVLNCLTILNRLSIGNSVTLRWVPGHSGITGNELADSLARKGSFQPLLGPEPCLPVAASCFRGAIRSWANELHSSYWRNLQCCRQSKLAMGNPSEPRSKILLSLSRSSIRAILMVLTGHGVFARHRFLQNQIGSPICSYCNSGDETAEHFVCICPIYLPYRIKYLGIGTSFSEACAPTNTPALLRFINESKRLSNSVLPAGLEDNPTQQVEDSPL